ncbi:class I SAM-dependent methyltransferase [Actinomycetospora soli]|uniref:class I SAM-dependent methyltransferase n=1 Tax=Actinomycetospora soli TaxID=2893887 RepID=UPI001E35ECC6|nr:class I SAM-dependent methyltransferase [Actinomycetospora soli]MCD2186648.1 class I SAM-dependent methyltransferase [Actinomycetospora soli]
MELQQEQRTMLWTLTMHAHDAASERPILNDPYAAELLARVDDPPDLGLSLGGNTPLICARAKLIDDIARGWLARHDEAVVLHLGCGLDSRVLRLDPGPGVQWFDVDQEPVIDLRRRLYPELRTAVAADVTDPASFDLFPADLPRLVLAEGLLMYLDPAGVDATVHGAMTRGSTLVADTVAPWVTWVAGLQPAMRAADTGFASSTADLARVAPRLVDELSLVDATATRTGGRTSTAVRLFALVPHARNAMVLQTYERA